MLPAIDQRPTLTSWKVLDGRPRPVEKCSLHFTTWSMSTKLHFSTGRHRPDCSFLHGWWSTASTSIFTELFITPNFYVHSIIFVLLSELFISVHFFISCQFSASFLFLERHIFMTVKQKKIVFIKKKLTTFYDLGKWNVTPLIGDFGGRVGIDRFL